MSCFYKFAFNEKDGKLSFEKCNENHDHSLELTNVKITQKMSDNLKLFNKKSRIIDIKESLEKYYVQFGYE